MADIFISYASEDRPRVKPLADALGRQGWSVWWDRTIPAGRTFAEVIDEELRAARSVVVVWSNTSVNKNWVLEEAEDGLERHILVPVLMDKVKPPRGFRRIHAADLIEWDGQESSPDIQKLITDLRAILGAPKLQKVQDEKPFEAPAAPEPASPRETKPQSVAEARDAGVGTTRHEKPSPELIPSWVRSWQFAAVAIVVLLVGGYLALGPERDEVPETAAETPPIEVKPIDELEEYVRIPAEEFEIGCVANDDNCDGDEKPRHAVQITKDFWIGRTEVTVGAYEEFAKATRREMPEAPDFNSSWRDKNHPINYVTWHEAEAYCTWIGGRLPTEPEWEYAARGGEEGLKYPRGGEISDKDANYGGAGGFPGTFPVDRYLANGFGLYDMAGNVWEWVADWYDKDYYKNSSAADPKGPPSGNLRVLRGGAWSTFRSTCVRRSATGTFPSTGTTASGSGVPGKLSLDPLTLFPLLGRSPGRVASEFLVRQSEGGTQQGHSELSAQRGVKAGGTGCDADPPARAPATLTAG